MFRSEFVRRHPLVIIIIIIMPTTTFEKRQQIIQAKFGILKLVAAQRRLRKFPFSILKLLWSKYVSRVSYNRDKERR